MQAQLPTREGDALAFALMATSESAQGDLNHTATKKRAPNHFAKDSAPRPFDHLPAQLATERPQVHGTTLPQPRTPHLARVGSAMREIRAPILETRFRSRFLYRHTQRSQKRDRKTVPFLGPHFYAASDAKEGPRAAKTTPLVTRSVVRDLASWRPHLARHRATA
jgi:hypothetical protein